MKNKFSICRWLGLMFYYAMGFPIPKGEPEPEAPRPEWSKAPPCQHTKSFYRAAKPEEKGAAAAREKIVVVNGFDWHKHFSLNGTYEYSNAYGELVTECPDCGDSRIVTCKHSTNPEWPWLCRSCKEKLKGNSPWGLPNAPLIYSLKPPEA